MHQISTLKRLMSANGRVPERHLLYRTYVLLFFYHDKPRVNPQIPSILDWKVQHSHGNHLLIIPHGQRSGLLFTKHEVLRFLGDDAKLRLHLHSPPMGRREQYDKENGHDDDEGCVAWQWVLHNDIALIAIALFKFHQVFSCKQEPGK